MVREEITLESLADELVGDSNKLELATDWIDALEFVNWLTFLSILLKPEEPDNKVLADIMKKTKGKADAGYLKSFIKEIKNDDRFKNLMHEIELTKSKSKSDVQILLTLKLKEK